MTNPWSWQQFFPGSNMFFANQEEPWPVSEALLDTLQVSRSLCICIYIFDIISMDWLYLRPLPHHEHRAIPDHINTAVTVTEISQAQALTWGVSGQESCRDEGSEEDKPASILMNWALLPIKGKKAGTRLTSPQTPACFLYRGHLF